MQKTYFASDFHLGIAGKLSSPERERKMVRWLDHIKEDAAAIYLVGDLFDFWFEYKSVIPKGYARLFGKLAELRDADLPIYFFTGNHDLWMFRYFEDEFGIPIYRKPIIRDIAGKTFFIGHGDGLGPDDYGYKRMKKVFTNPLCQWLFARLHPNLGLGVARYFSIRSRHQDPVVKHYLGDDKEWLVAYANRKSEQLAQKIDYFIFGHRHLPIQMTLKNQHSQYINIGEWLYACSYGVFDGEKMEIEFFETEDGRVFP
ncbi:MAG: UDP-2,3-diacylglucosamine diphosphatase [Bacteroidota bacterium]